MSKARVLIVEDELIAAEFLKEIVQSVEGVEVIGSVDSGKAAIEQAKALRPDIIFMDIMLRDNISGSEAALSISKEITTKIIFLSAYVDDEMVDYAVASHAAGYLTKPYNEAQIKATLRLALSNKEEPKVPTAQESEESSPVALIDGFVFDVEHQRLLKDGVQVELGAKGIKLLGLLCKHPDISISNEQIMMHVWGEVVNDKTLRSLLFRVRSMTSENLIKNVSGTGYMVQSEK